jgi:hypothetical protein
MIREINRFIASSDNGTQHTIILYQHYRTHRPLSGSPTELPTIREYRTSTGHSVNVIDEDAGLFQIVQTDETVRKR